MTFHMAWKETQTQFCPGRYIPVGKVVRSQSMEFFTRSLTDKKKSLQQSGVKISKRPAFLGGKIEKTLLLKPIEYHIAMVSKGLRGRPQLGTHHADEIFCSGILHTL